MKVKFKLEGTIGQIKYKKEDELKVALNGDICINDVNVWFADIDGNYAILLPKEQEFIAKRITYDLLGKKGTFCIELEINSWPTEEGSKIRFKDLDRIEIVEMVFTNGN